MQNTISRQIEIVQPSPPHWFCAKADELRDTLRGLGRLNVFIGRNNSGKSRLLRKLFLEQSFNSIPDCEIARNIERYQFEALGLAEEASEVPGAQELLCQIGGLDLQKLLSNHGQEVVQFWRNRCGEFPKASPVGTIVRRWAGLLDLFRSEVVEARKALGPTPIARIFVPALRSAQRFINSSTAANMTENLLLAQFERTQFEHPIGNPKLTMRLADIGTGVRKVFNGVELHDILHDLRLGELGHRRLLERFETQLGDRFFGGQTVQLIPKRTDPVLHIRVGKEKERRIDELGDGLQHLIILTFPHFLFESQPLMLFIEEPELYMHPGLQRDVIEALLDPAFGPPNMGPRQFFVATHSSQFIDLTLDQADISIYRLTKRIPDDSTDSGDARTPTFEIALTAGPDMQILADLGVKNSSLLLTNATVWVEGITDRMYIKRIMELLQGNEPQRVREDVHYSFVEYGGANVVHWSVLEDDNEPSRINVDRLCGRLVLITDQDASKRTKRHDKIRKVLGDRFLVLEAREIENLLGPAVLPRTLNRLAPSARFPGTVTHEQYQFEPLGRWLDETLTWPEDSKVRHFAAESGTVGPKLQFARAACNEIQVRDDLTRQAADLGERIIKFVRAQC